MSDTSRQRDLWRFPALALWILFFLIGLVPEDVYVLLRRVAGVLPQRALINSYHLITFGLAGYVGLFCYNRCLDAGLPSRDAQDRGLQLTVVGLVAFLSIDFGLLIEAYSNPIFQFRFAVCFVAISKILAWASLMTLLIRYYALGDDHAFASIPSLFPSSHLRPKGGEPPAETPEPASDTPEDDGETDNADGAAKE